MGGGNGQKSFTAKQRAAGDKADKAKAAKKADPANKALVKGAQVQCCRPDILYLCWIHGIFCDQRIDRPHPTLQEAYKCKVCMQTFSATTKLLELTVRSSPPFIHSLYALVHTLLLASAFFHCPSPCLTSSCWLFADACRQQARQDWRRQDLRGGRHEEVLREGAPHLRRVHVSLLWSSTGVVAAASRFLLLHRTLMRDVFL
jgi:hypothetical protein